MQVKPHTAILSLGSNLGDRAVWLSRAALAVASLSGTEIVARSSFYEAEPVDVPDKFKNITFLNAVIIIETTLTPRQLSDSVHRIEDLLQRRRGEPNQPRTVDIDLISFDQLISTDPELTLPHPQACLRRFVLLPLVEIAPDLILPGLEESAQMLLSKLPETPYVRLSSEQWTD